MDLPKAIIANIGPNEGHQAPSLGHVIADIVLVDETNNVLQPLLYRLKEANSDHHSFYDAHGETPSFLDEDLFTVLGAVIYIDRDKKIITLINRNTVSYKHLIVASGRKPGGAIISQHDFSHGLHTLLDAMRLRQTIQQTTTAKKGLSPRLSSEHTHSQLGVKETVSSISVKRAILPTMSHVSKKLTAISDLNTIEKLLYVVSLDTENG